MDQELQRERYELVTGRIREIAKEESVPARYQEYFQKAPTASAPADALTPRRLAVFL